ncbi:sensory neuron membrane protein 2-like [Onthophagus taurus]|uniref:sensory neuron membrane protein 2-like n=1 Tax=Onthophagus taurus TaxID=166361 RepID=UPI000C1FE95A|nr:sensory neuron membrane protein 2-like [Onthophagus taurus]
MGCCKPRTIALSVSAVGIVLLIIGCVLGFGVIPGIIDDQVAENVQLIEGSEAYERWEETPVVMKFKVHIFTVTNPDDVIAGGTPKVEEKGPYVYDLYRKKEDIAFIEEDDAYEYIQNTYFEFNKDESQGLTEEDEITVLNVAQQGVLQKAEDMSTTEQFMIELNMDNIFTDTPNTLFHTITVGEFLFGGYKFCDHVPAGTALVCNKIKAQAETVETITLVPDEDDESKYTLLFAFFKHKQNKKDGPYVVKSGISDANEVAEIISWKGLKELDFWGNETDNICNKVRGRDSSIYPPFNDEDTVHEVFNTDICRILTLNYEGEGTYKDVDGFVSTLNVNNLLNRDEGECYCVKNIRNLDGEKDCLPDGFGDLSPCTGATVIMSFPHFLDADETYANTVEGLSPDRDLHKTYVLMEPKTGSPLQGAKRMQFNMILRPIKAFDRTKNLKPSVLPLLWVEEGVALTDELIEKLNEQYFDKLVMVDAIVYTLIAVGAVLAIVGGVVFLIKK